MRLSDLDLHHSINLSLKGFGTEMSFIYCLFPSSNSDYSKYNTTL